MGIALAAVVALAGLMAACQSSGQSAGNWAPKTNKVYETDVLIVGAGGSGLACAVQSAINGTNFILIEKADYVGGNANYVEGMFAIGSQFQQAKGINIKPVEIINAELSRGQFRANGALWMDLCL
jgi:fumarate reductase flavoprotein subunit